MKHGLIMIGLLFCCLIICHRTIKLIKTPINIISPDINNDKEKEKENEKENDIKKEIIKPIFKTEDFILEKILDRKNDNKTYTQGLFFSKDHKSIFESGGLYYESSIIELEYPSLKMIKKTNLKSNYFGEGISQCGNYIYQLTWRENIILKYDLNLNLIEEINLDNKMREGWGLSNSDKKNELLATDGSEKIYRLDCNNNLKVISKIFVKKNNGEFLYQLNDLIYANGFVYVNIYYEDKIAKVNLKNGLVDKIYDLGKIIDYEMKNGILNSRNYNSGNVLNGIAYNSEKNNFLITGKKWKFMYEISFN